MQFANTLNPLPCAVVLLRDLDDQPDARKRGFRQALDESPWDIPTIVGLARPNRECWVLAAFIPTNKLEQKRLDDLRQDLGFNPTHCPEQLTAKHEYDRKNAKRALTHLLGGNVERGEQCWRGINDSRVTVQCDKAGLLDYLQDIEKHHAFLVGMK